MNRLSETPHGSESELGAQPKPKARTTGYLVAAFAGGNGIAMVLRMAGGLLVGRVVEPAALGLFNGIGLALGWCQFLHFGVMNGLNRELPYYFGKGDHKRLGELAGAAQALAILLGAVLAASCLVVASCYLFRGSWHLAAGWAAIAVSGFSLFYGQYYLQTTFRTSGDFARLAAINVVQGALALVLVVLAWWLSFFGLCLRAVIGSLAQLALTWHWRPLRVKAAWRWEHLRHLWRIGAPIFIVGQIYDWWTVLDSTLVLVHLGAYGLGLYAVAMVGGTAMQTLPDAVAQVLYPQMAERWGRGAQTSELVHYALRKTLLLCLGFLPLLVLAWFSVGPAVRNLLPKYVDAIPAARWCLLVAAVRCLMPAHSIFNVVRRQDLFITCILGGLGAYYGVLCWLMRKGAYLSAFPQAMAVGRFVMAMLCFGALAWLVRKGRVDAGDTRMHG